MRTVFIECGYIMTAKDRAAMEAGIASKTGDDVRVVLLPYGAHVAEPKPEWIPTKERMPEKRGRYLVYLAGMLPGNTTVSKISAALFWPGVWPEWTVDGGGIGNVVAWMPLPEPYEEGE